MTQEENGSSIHSKDQGESSSCPSCNGRGIIFLDYVEEYDTSENQGERWLPCGDCDGTGVLSEGVMTGRQRIKRRESLVEGFAELLFEIFRPH